MACCRYQFLEYVCTVKLKLESNSGRFVGAKLCADTFLFGPLHLLIFFFYMSVAAGKSLLQFQQDLQRDYFPTLLSEGVLWTCVQVTCFSFFTALWEFWFHFGIDVLLPCARWLTFGMCRWSTSFCSWTAFASLIVRSCRGSSTLITFHGSIGPPNPKR